VLEAGEVATREDQVHPLLVGHVEVANRRAITIDNTEAQRLAPAARQLGLVDHDAQVVLSDRETAHALLRRGAVANAGVICAVRSRVGVPIGVDGPARERRAGKHQD
jgi:hypothetical protein